MVSVGKYTSPMDAMGKKTGGPYCKDGPSQSSIQWLEILWGDI